MVRIWILALGLFALFWIYGKPFANWAFKLPREWHSRLSYHLSDWAEWLLNEAGFFGLFTVKDVTRGLSDIIAALYGFVRAVLEKGMLSGQGSDAIQILPPLSWIAVIFIVFAIGHYARDWKLGIFAAACFGYLALFGQWQSAMVTLSSIIIAVPFGVTAGLLLGLAGHRWLWFGRIMQPLLDLMQTVPVFAYLVPILVFFGFNAVSAILATVIYATPPMVRITMLALRQVPSELVDLANMVGCTRQQKTWKVMVPSARESLMTGVNQVIMLSLNMVIIASMIGAGGLGFDILTALRRLDFGTGLEAGLAIVVLAIALDRLSQAVAQRMSEYKHHDDSASLVERYGITIAAIVVVLVTGFAGLLWAGFQTWPENWTLTTGKTAGDVVKYININYFDFLDGIKSSLLINVLIPFKRFLISLPWPGVVILLGLAGYSLKGWRLAILCMALSSFIAFSGLWEKAMITVYLCGISVVIAFMIGIPIGILAAERERTWRIVRVIIDTLQTLPSFVYLMPIVMLFRVGDFTALIAVVAYAVAPAIRYTVLGLKQVDANLVEAGIASGCTRLQLLTKIKLRLALPEILLGLNQTIMLALSMLVITALVGTRDLGQEVYIGLTKGDIGRGMVAGLCIAFIAIIADRIIKASADRLKARLGMEEGS
ncbi:MAG: ABC transporter permease subunit [Rhizobiaceae bacterium]|nr:ABC transporter permease subunit [Rhizobiaceae bacterium]